MYSEEEIKKSEKKRKIVDVIFLFTIILWSIVWLLWIWLDLVKSSINPFLGAFLGFLILGTVSVAITKFFIWLNGEVGKIKGE